MNNFICPVCSEILIKTNTIYKCINNHTFDISKKGYVNLLMSQNNKNKQHGDDKIMVSARRDFLNKGYYSPFMQEICKMVNKYAENNYTILDAGCGECYYTNNIYKYLLENGKCVDLFGIDISKNALEISSREFSQINKTVASVFKIPMQEDSCDILINIFSPFSDMEYKRVIKTGGKLILAIPLENHLWELKEAVYEKPYKNEVATYNIDGYNFLEEKRVEYDVTLQGNDTIKNLFMMTPYYYKTSKTDFDKLDNYEILSTRLEFAILVYEKI